MQDGHAKRSKSSSEFDTDLCTFRENRESSLRNLCRSSTVFRARTKSSHITSLQQQTLRWHNRTGHPSPSWCLRLAQTFEEIMYVSRSTLKSLLCAPCQLRIARRAKVTQTPDTITYPLVLVPTCIAGPVANLTGGSIYSICVLQSFTAKSDIFFLNKKLDLPKYVIQYMTETKLETCYSFHKIDRHGAGEHISSTVEQFCVELGIQLEPSPPYARQSNDTAEGLNEEFWACTRVHLFA